MLSTRRVAVLSLLALAACGGSSSPSTPKGNNLEILLPADNQISGWTRSKPIRILSAAKAGEGYATDGSASGGVDGDAARFIENGLVSFGWAFYKAAGTEKIELRVWDMGSASNASRCWTALITTDARYKGANWSETSVGEAGRISDTGTYWWVVARKGAYVAEIMLEPDDAAQKQVAIDFLKSVVAAIP
jgi:hypothetical protein